MLVESWTASDSSSGSCMPMLCLCCHQPTEVLPLPRGGWGSNLYYLTYRAFCTAYRNRFALILRVILNTVSNATRQSNREQAESDRQPPLLPAHGPLIGFIQITSATTTCLLALHCV